MRNTLYIKIVLLVAVLIISATVYSFTPKYLITKDFSFKINQETWDVAPGAGDTIYISNERTNELWFENLYGDSINPITIINFGGQVKINCTTQFAMKFVNCKYLHVTGSGDSDFFYGINLTALNTGLQFTGLSSDIEASNIKIDLDGFFGIYAKEDYHGEPPIPIPQFYNLTIHDCFVTNVAEGMYLGETISPGMEFRHVKIYNNIVYHTGRESIQIANMVEDVKIYNNTLVEAGLDQDLYQENILQIGDNSVAEVYNNIIIGAKAFGIISFGNGDNKFHNNYLADCQGIFIDNRKFTDTVQTIEITDNYFRNTEGDAVIKNLNEINPLSIHNNEYNTEILFYLNSSNADRSEEYENRLTNVEGILFRNIEEDDFTLSTATPSRFKALGAHQIKHGEVSFGIGKSHYNLKKWFSGSENLICKIFPNPSSDQFVIKYCNDFKSYDVSVYNTTGIPVFEKQIIIENYGYAVIDIPPEIPNGEYILKCTAQDSISETHPIVILK